MAYDHAEHIIFANNILFGLTRFVTLALPPEWRITRSYLEPDVHSNVRSGELLWVEAGQTDQVVYHPWKRVALDLTIQVKRGKRDQSRPKGVKVHSQGSKTINGHEAIYLLGEVGVGFLKRKIARTLHVSFHCSELGRTILMRFTGACQENDLLEILECITELECH